MNKNGNKETRDKGFSDDNEREQERGENLLQT